MSPWSVLHTGSAREACSSGALRCNRNLTINALLVSMNELRLCALISNKMAFGHSIQEVGNQVSILHGLNAYSVSLFVSVFVVCLSTTEDKKNSAHNTATSKPS